MADVWLKGAKRVTYDLPRLQYRSGAKLRLVLHATETPNGSSRPPGYRGGKTAPQCTYDVTTRTLWEHWPLNVAGRALVNESGGVETNREGAVQVELVGTCDPKRRGEKGIVYLPDLTDEQLLRIGMDVVGPICEAMGIPLTDHGLRWLPYPSSYGFTSARMTDAEWKAFSGICGHSHADENYHGDPGDFPFARMIQLLEDDMATANEVWNFDGIPNWRPATSAANPSVQADFALGEAWRLSSSAADSAEAAVKAGQEAATAAKAAAAASVAATQAAGRTEAAVKAIALGGVDVQALAQALTPLVAAAVIDQLRAHPLTPKA